MRTEIKLKLGEGKVFAIINVTIDGAHDTEKLIFGQNWT